MSFLSKIGSSSSSGGGWGYVRSPQDGDGHVGGDDEVPEESDGDDEVPEEESEESIEGDGGEKEDMEETPEEETDSGDDDDGEKEDDIGDEISPFQSPQYPENGLGSTPAGNGIIRQTPGSATPGSNRKPGRNKELFPLR